MIQQVRKLGPLMVPVTIHAIIGSEDIIDAMDLRAFGVGPRTWLEQLHYRLRDRLLIAFGAVILLASLAWASSVLGKFWVPESAVQAGRRLGLEQTTVQSEGLLVSGSRGQ